METRDRQTTREELNRLLSDEELGRLQLTTLQYYLHESNPANGLVRDKTDPRAPSSIAAVGLALATIPMLVERGVISREFAPSSCSSGCASSAIASRGRSRTRPDTWLLLPFPRCEDRAARLELRTLDHRFSLPVCRNAHRSQPISMAIPRRKPKSPTWPIQLYCRADWQVGRRMAAPRLCHGWHPETGFIPTPLDEVTTKACSSICSALARRPSRCRPRVIAPTVDI